MTHHHICLVLVPASGKRERGRGAPPPPQSKAIPKISSCTLCAYVLNHSVVSDSATPCTVAHQAPLSMDSPGKNTGVGCHALLQGFFPPLTLLRPFCPEVSHWSHLASRDAGKCSLYSGWLQVHQKFGSLSSKEEVNAHWGTIAVSATKQETGNEISPHTSVPGDSSWSVCGPKGGRSLEFKQSLKFLLLHETRPFNYWILKESKPSDLWLHVWNLFLF